MTPSSSQFSRILWELYPVYSVRNMTLVHNLNQDVGQASVLAGLCMEFNFKLVLAINRDVTWGKHCLHYTTIYALGNVLLVRFHVPSLCLLVVIWLCCSTCSLLQALINSCSFTKNVQSLSNLMSAFIISCSVQCNVFYACNNYIVSPTKLITL